MPEAREHTRERDRIPSGYALNMLTLFFRDPEVERAFLRADLRAAMSLIRLSLFFAALLYASFGVLDFYIVGADLKTVWLIRFGVVCPILAAVMLTTFLPAFRRLSQLLLSLSMLAAGLGVVAMTAVTSPPANSLYYAGLIMVVIYGSTMVRLRFVYSAAISIVLVLAYEVVALGLNPIPRITLVSNNFFLLMATAVGIFASYIQELYIRRNYIATQLLRTEKERSEELLDESRAANHAKSEFLAIVSHELRTPLNAIIGFSEFLKMEMFGPIGSDRYRTYAQDIYSSGQHLLEIINDILDLSKAEANKLELAEEEVDLHQVLDSCLRMFLNRAAAEGVRLGYEADVHPVLRADPRLVSQVVINLLTNAVKFTAKGGEVTVSVQALESGECVVRVRDSGIGIAEEDLPKILEPFVQVESSATRSHEGLGLGLPLVKRIMEHHGGRLDIESVLGEGTTVIVTFPAARVLSWHAARHQPRPAGTGG